MSEKEDLVLVLHQKHSHQWQHLDTINISI